MQTFYSSYTCATEGKIYNMPFQMYKCTYLKRCQRKAKTGMKAGFDYPKYVSAQSEHNNEPFVQQG